MGLAAFLGTLVDDLNVSPHLADAGVKLEAEIDAIVGGGAANAARAFLGAAGVPPRLLGITGDDPLGAMLVQQALAELPGAVQVPTASRTRRSILLHDACGERGRAIVYTRRNQIDGPATFAAVEPHLNRAETLLIASLTAADAELFQRLVDRACGSVFALPTLSQLRDGRSVQLLKWCGFVQMNEHEGKAVTGADDPVEMLCRLRERGFRGTLIVTTIDDGLHADRDGEWFHAASLEVSAVNDVGAGDTVAGTLLAGLELGRSFDESLRGAAAAAAMHVAKRPRAGGWDELIDFSRHTPAKQPTLQARTGRRAVARVGMPAAAGGAESLVLCPWE